MMSIIDVGGNCMLIDMESKDPREDITNFKKSDVWKVVWANVSYFIIYNQEKFQISLLIFKGSTRFICCHGKN